MWQTLLRRKYLRFKSLTQVEHSPGDSHFWSGLMRVKPEFLRWGKFKLGNRSLIRFWEDTWLGNEPLKNQYSAMYNIVRKKSALVSSVLCSIPLNVSFRRSLVANNLLSWHQLVARVMDIQLQDQSDSFVWSLQQDGVFLVRSMYRAITATNIIPHNHIIWKLNCHLRLRFLCGT